MKTNREFDEEMGCHDTYHFEDVAIQRDRFDRNLLVEFSDQVRKQE